VAGEKMSKSLGNSLRVEEMLETVRPAELRYYLGQAHYRSVLEFSDDALSEAATAYGRIEGFVQRAADALANAAEADTPTDPAAGAAPDAAPSLPLSFTAALDDDLGVPAALAAVHAAVRDGNSALQAGQLAETRDILAQVRAMLNVLGLDPLAEPWTGRARRDDRIHDVVEALVSVTLDQRDAARARRDYATADALRDGLEKAGIMVEDTADGPRWKLRR
jgi:cysteinyl-tRNA synthetase